MSMYYLFVDEIIFWPFTMEVRVQFHSCGICGGQSVTATGYHPVEKLR